MTPSTLRRAIYGLAAALLLGGLAFGRPDERKRNRIPRPLRMLSSALVLLAALLSWRSAGERSRRAAGLLAGGMGCGLLGDLFMASVIPLPKPVIGGMLSFGVGHILYIRAFLLLVYHKDGDGWVFKGGLCPPLDPPLVARQLQYGRPLRTIARKLLYTSLALAWIGSLAGWWVLVRRSAVAPALKYGALAYTLLLGSTSGLTAALALHDRRYTPTALGGALFFASDAILASELFRKVHFPGIGDAIWLTYIAGQALIVDAPDLDSR